MFWWCSSTGCGYCGYQILQIVYRIFEKPKFKKNYVQNTNFETSGTDIFFYGLIFGLGEEQWLSSDFFGNNLTVL